MPTVAHSTVIFTGHVQGVGFRYATSQVAREFDISGTVSNLDDGGVKLEAEGTRADVDAFIEAVKERMHGYIRKEERKDGSREARLAGFLIT
jgi:acylphosphatase